MDPKIKREFLSLAYQLIRLRGEHHNESLGELIVHLNNESIELFEKGNTAFQMDVIVEITKACILHLYMKYDNDKKGYLYHIF